VPRKTTEYSVPRLTAQPISPSATSAGDIGVASTASYSRAYFSLKNTFIVESYTAPFIADDAMRAGATNSA
jgi:hypothetical protein